MGASGAKGACAHFGGRSPHFAARLGGGLSCPGGFAHKGGAGAQAAVALDIGSWGFDATSPAASERSARADGAPDLPLILTPALHRGEDPELELALLTPTGVGAGLGDHTDRDLLGDALDLIA